MAVKVNTYAVRAENGKYRVVYVGPGGGERIIARYGDESSAVKLYDLLIAQQGHEVK